MSENGNSNLDKCLIIIFKFYNLMSVNIKKIKLNGNLFSEFYKHFNTVGPDRNIIKDQPPYRNLGIRFLIFNE